MNYGYRSLKTYAVMLLLFLSAVLGFYSLGRRVSRYEIDRLSWEQQAQETQFKAVEVKIEELSQQIENLNKNDAALRRTVGLDQIPDEVYQVGIGGREKIWPTQPSPAKEAWERLDRISRGISLLRINLEEAEYKATENAEFLSRIPSISPVPGGLINSRFGMRIHPIYGVEAMHEGVDLAAKEGTPIIASADGVVTFNGNYGGYGRMIEIDHGNGIVTRYAHNRINKVRVGQRVTRGQIVALVGSTGITTSSHLHYEVRRDGKAVDPLPHILPGAIVD